ncbi:uncharacterized protein GLRG_02204 [Colletotrichum graminicola M1.001]|uniref:Uncharacterized protein n=1 Tax=Colletotrichum graminicola (strain M1.001 / M2 / FGSC 10212) TaxID=645133 RepID=E3Q821_COLGM|nr:uncharacterized protein GLRG_02204 [Colletotrichum graminicola M1.001]EFQ27033.1 hypothetical protein GLRG_02204 [Colletotrichum graminicola M1.001]
MQAVSGRHVSRRKRRPPPPALSTSSDLLASETSDSSTTSQRLVQPADFRNEPDEELVFDNTIRPAPVACRRDGAASLTKVPKSLARPTRRFLALVLDIRHFG